MARMSVRQMWAAKLAGKPVPAATALLRAATSGNGTGQATLPARTPYAGLVLGVDPSLRGTGLALIEFTAGGVPRLLRCRTVHVPARQPMSVALAEIHRAVAAMLE